MATKKKTELLTRLWDDDKLANSHVYRADGALVAFDVREPGKVSLLREKTARVLAKLAPAAVSTEGPCAVAGAAIETDDDANVVRAAFHFDDQKEDLTKLVEKDETVAWVAMHPAGEAAVACVQLPFGAERSKLRVFRKGAAPRTLTIEEEGGTTGLFDAKGRLLVVTSRAVDVYDLDGKKVGAWPAKLTPSLTTLTRAGERVLAMDRADNVAHVFGEDGEVAAWKDAEATTAALTWDGRYMLVVTGGSVDLVDVAKRKRVASMKAYSFALRLAVGPGDEVAVPGAHTTVYRLNRPA